jgi:hypothetical protein
MNIKIEAFYQKEDGKDLILLPKTSNYLTDKQLIPDNGDFLTLDGDDGKIIGLEITSLKNIMTVKKKWLRYASCDVAVILYSEEID